MSNKIKRFQILLALFVGYIVVYLDKLSVGIASISIQDELGMSDSQKGILLGSFFLGYALLQIPMSIVINRFGSKAIVLWSIIMIGFFDYFFSLSDSIVLLISLRLFSGMIAHSGFSSATSKELTNSFPVEERTFAKGILLSASGIASILGPLIISPIIYHFGWRSMYRMLALFAILVSLYIAYMIPNNSHRTEKKEKKTIGIITIWKQPIVWVLFTVAIGINGVLYGVINWMPTYLTNTIGLSLKTVGLSVSVIGIFLLIGSAGGGYLVGKFFKDKDVSVITCTSLIGGVLIISSYFISSTPLFTFVVGLSMLSLTISFVTLMTIPLKIFKDDYFAPSYATIATGGILGGAITQIIIGLLVQHIGKPISIFLYFLIISMVSSLVIKKAQIYINIK